MGYKSKIYLGVDVGSRTTKILGLTEREILDAIYQENKPGLGSMPNCEGYSCGVCRDSCSTGSVMQTIEEFVDSLKSEHPYLGEVGSCVVTGSQMDPVLNPGTVKKMKSKFPTVYVTEINSQLRGFDYLSPGRIEKSVIDIGGQDTKVIVTRLKEIHYNGKKYVVDLDFVTNPKCAGATGAFIESAAEFLEVPIEDFGKIAMKGFHGIRGKGDIISSRCATFARENLTKLQQHYTKEELAAATCMALAKRTRSLANPKIGNYFKEIVFQGGVASNEGMVHALSEVFGKKIKVPQHRDIEVGAHRVMGALGAASLAEDYKDKIAEFYRRVIRERVPLELQARDIPVGGGSK